MKVQIIEDESLLEYAEFDEADVWLLNRTTSSPLDERVVNVDEITQSLEPVVVKFPKLFTEIANKYFDNGLIPTDFAYQVVTKNPQNYIISYFVCDMEAIRDVSE